MAVPMTIKRLIAAGLVTISTLGVAQAQEPIRAGVDVPYPPFEMRQPDGTLTGFEIELGNAVCQRITEQDCEWVVQAWDGIIPGLSARKFDMIFSSMSINDERRKRVGFSEPYYSIPSAFFTRDNSDFDPADTAGMRIGVQRATTQDTYLTEFHTEADIVRYSAANDALVDLTGGRIDALFIGAPVGQEMIADKPDLTRVGGLINKPASIFGEGVGAAFRKRDQELQAAVNQALRDLKADGTYHRLMNRYFDINIEN